MIRHTHSPKRSHGFSLLEVLVAFAILILVVGVVLQIYSTGARSIALAEDYSRAVDVAEGVLDAAGHGGDLAVGIVEGRTADGYYWTRTVSDSTTSLAGAADARGSSVGLRDVDVEVRWRAAGADRALKLSTVKLAVP